jgi:hypothetical protein
VSRQAATLSRSLLIRPAPLAGQRARQLAGIRHARRSFGASSKSRRANQTLLDETPQPRRTKKSVSESNAVGCESHFPPIENRGADTVRHRQLPES